MTTYRRDESHSQWQRLVWLISHILLSFVKIQSDICHSINDKWGSVIYWLYYKLKLYLIQSSEKRGNWTRANICLKSCFQNECNDLSLYWVVSLWIIFLDIPTEQSKCRGYSLLICSIREVFIKKINESIKFVNKKFGRNLYFHF